MGILTFLNKLFKGPELPLQTVLDNEIFRDILSSCGEGASLIINHGNEECWVRFDARLKYGDADSLGYSKMVVDRRSLGILFRHITREPQCLHRCHGISIEGTDGKLILQANDGFSVGFISDLPSMSYLGHTPAKLAAVLGYNYLSRQNARDPIWLVNDFEPVKKSGKLEEFITGLTHEFDRLYLCTEEEPEELPGRWVETVDFSYRIPEHGGCSELAEWLAKDEWVIYSSVDPEEKDLIDSIIRAEPAEAFPLMKKGKISFLVEGKPDLKHYRILRA